MNRQIVQLFGLFALLFAVLLVFTSRWTVFEASSLEDNPDNRRPLIEEQQIPRGLILRLGRQHGARAQPRRGARARTAPTRAPIRPARTFAHPVGFSYIRNGRRGLEASRNDELVGRGGRVRVDPRRASRAATAEGNDVVTNLDVRGTQAAVAGLAGRKGAVVAIEPKTGKVRVMVSVPEYDPNLIPSQIGQLNRDPNQPLLNRTTQELYPPGSTFKVVTATAALDSGKITPETVIDGSSPKEISGVPLENAGGESFGPISVTDALTNSVNTVLGAGRRAASAATRSSST